MKNLVISTIFLSTLTLACDESASKAEECQLTSSAMVMAGPIEARDLDRADVTFREGGQNFGMYITTVDDHLLRQHVAQRKPRQISALIQQGSPTPVPPATPVTMAV